MTLDLSPEEEKAIIEALLIAREKHRYDYAMRGKIYMFSRLIDRLKEQGVYEPYKQEHGNG